MGIRGRLCCSLDARCQDICKEDQKIHQRILDGIQRFFPKLPVEYFNLRLIRSLGLIVAISAVAAVLLTLVYANIKTNDDAVNALLQKTLWNVFSILIIIGGIISWLFVLTRESQILAQDESRRQTRLLISEIDAHQKTDSQLQVAKEQAEAANNAKSRYLTGISPATYTHLTLPTICSV